MRNVKQQKRMPIREQFKRERLVTQRKDGSFRVQLDFSNTTSRTKPEFLKEVNINNIVKLPQMPIPPLTYADLTDPPNLRQLFQTIHDVKESFSKLPSDIRKLMDNDPAKMQSFICDPKNYSLLVSRGILKERETSSEKSSQNASAESSKASKVPKKASDEA